MKSTRLVSEDMKFCPGLDKEEYHEYREVIRYDLKNVRIITSPVERYLKMYPQQKIPVIVYCVQHARSYVTI